MSSAEADALWYKDAIIYQLHVRSFSDSTNDGVGDFKGLADRLDYIRDLGVTAIWLLPFYPSPLKDDGYDIADYTNVNPSYGTLADFEHFLREAHDRKLKVITELVINHTSDQHPWFKRARRAPKGSVERDFYVWSDTPDLYREARIIFKDFEHSNWTWDPVAGAYFWHRFYSHQPDLNFQNPEVRKAVLKAMDFWFALGVDGFRLDAVPYLFEREGTSCENLLETHLELKHLRSHVDNHFKHRMLLAEANQWPEDAAAYFGSGDECHMAFHFPLMPRMFMALKMEDRYPVLDILNQTPAIPDNCQWAVFLRNHDELTLEMVTDEERDYMYRTFAKDPQARINLGIRRRLAPLLGNDRRQIELMNGLLLAMPGTPVIYYGDEIGMGDNIFLGDRNGVRTPMQWSADRNAGFSRASSQRLFLPVITEAGYSYEALNVEAQHGNSLSLLWWMRNLISLRRRHRAFGRGTLEFLYPANRKVLAFLRCHEGEELLVVANLSRFAQCVELDLSSRAGKIPVEMFGHTRFPAVANTPYTLSLAPYGFYWFTLAPPKLSLDEGAPRDETKDLPNFYVEETWLDLLRGPSKPQFEEFVSSLLPSRRWYAGKARTIKTAELIEVIPLAENNSCLALFRVDYLEGDPETYLLSMTYARGERAREVAQDPGSAVARVWVDGEEGILFSGVRDMKLNKTLLDLLSTGQKLEGRRGNLFAITGPSGAARLADLIAKNSPLEPNLLSAEQSNTSIAFGKSLILKLFRKVEEGRNPDVEIGEFLTEEAHFPHTAPLLGYLEYRPSEGEPSTLAVLQAFVPNDGDAWNYTLDHVRHYFERTLSRPSDSILPAAPGPILTLASGTIPGVVHELVGGYLESARLLGQRTAEMHLALLTPTEDPQFKPEPFTPFYQRSLLQSFRNLTEEVFSRLGSRLETLAPEVQGRARQVLSLKSRIGDVFRGIVSRNVSALRTRLHGDYHLGQVLWTGRDFIIIDFEGEPLRPISARRIKRSPLRDTAAMIRSLNYAAHQGVHNLRRQGLPVNTNLDLDDLAEHWYQWSASAFLRAYLRTAEGAAFLPKDREELALLLDVYLLEKAVYELDYELRHRPNWVHLPLRGIERLVARSG
ncbi:MAG TPA: maltose alpha-D-glucosyltransferase [Polyangiaceae bacterium]|nr:maltose alpha-D-glucosyltransferase [Polyangiaceae bacterium]